MPDYSQYWEQYEEAKDEIEEATSELEDALDDYDELSSEIDDIMAKYYDAVSSGASALAKIYADCIADLLGHLAAIATIIAGLFGILSGALGVMALLAAEFPPAAAFLGGAAGGAAIDAGAYTVLGGAAWEGSNIFYEIAEDPPRSDYKKKIKLPRFKAIKWAGVTGAQSRHAIAVRTLAQRQYTLNQMLPSMLESLEKFKGAQKAGDRRFVRHHARVLHLLLRRSKRSTARLKGYTLDLAKNLDGSDLNVRLAKKHVDIIRAAIKKHGWPKQMREGLVAAGLTPAKITAFTKWFMKYDLKDWKEAKLSWHLRQIHFKLMAAEKKLAKA